MEESDWRSANFRQKMVGQIEEAMRKVGVAHNQAGKDMENQIFTKTRSQEEYLSLVARLIIHFRDIHNKKSQASVSDPSTDPQSQASVSDLMNALKISLPGQQPPGTAGM